MTREELAELREWAESDDAPDGIREKVLSLIKAEERRNREWDALCEAPL